jgi:hypothetical protein
VPVNANSDNSISPVARHARVCFQIEYKPS